MTDRTCGSIDYTEGEYAGYLNEHKSASGYIFLLAGGAISWCAARSSQSSHCWQWRLSVSQLWRHMVITLSWSPRDCSACTKSSYSALWLNDGDRLWKIPWEDKTHKCEAKLHKIRTEEAPKLLCDQKEADPCMSTCCETICALLTLLGWGDFANLVGDDWPNCDGIANGPRWRCGRLIYALEATPLLHVFILCVLEITIKAGEWIPASLLYELITWRI